MNNYKLYRELIMKIFYRIRETSKYDFSLSRNVFNQSSIPYLLLLKGILLIKWDEFARTFR